MKKLKPFLSDPLWQGIVGLISFMSLFFSVGFWLSEIDKNSKQLVVDHLGAVIPFYGENTQSRVRYIVDGLESSTLIVGMVEIRNTGKTAILPQDFIEPLEVRANSPFEIIGVDDREDIRGTVTTKWIDEGEGVYSMEPLLLNPGEYARFLLTVKTDLRSRNPKSFGEDKPSVFDDYVDIFNKLQFKWRCRIVNMSQLKIINPEKVMKFPKVRLEINTPWGISIFLTNKYFFIFLSVAFILLVITGFALIRLNPFKNSQLLKICIVCFGIFFSVSTAEILAHIYELGFNFLAWISYPLVIGHGIFIFLILRFQSKLEK